MHMTEDKMDAMMRMLKRLEMQLPGILDNKTLERWHGLPLTLDQQTMLEWTGFNRHDFEGEVNAGRVRICRKAGGRYASTHPRYYKHDLLQYIVGEHALPKWLKQGELPVDEPAGNGRG